MMQKLHMMGLATQGDSMTFGRQEDAHEFLNRMLTVSMEHFVNQAGGPKVLGLRCQETTIFHHIFGCYALNQLECLVRSCDAISAGTKSQVPTSSTRCTPA
jgi:hypothetical protein